MIREVRASGTYYSVGSQIGRKTAKDIREILAKKKFSRIKSVDGYKDIYSWFLSHCKNVFPEYVEELRGMADGADVDFEELFIYNVHEIRNLLGFDRYGVEHCTTILIPWEDRILCGHNEDGDVDDDIFILRQKAGDEQEFIAICYCGRLAGLGPSVNANGLFQTTNYLRIKEYERGVPLGFHARKSLVQGDLDSAVRVLRDAKRAYGEHYFLSQGKSALSIELTPRNERVVEVVQPTVHTNHYLDSDLRVQESLPKTSSSISRYNRTCELLCEDEDIESMKRIFSDETNAPKSICTHDYAGSRTLATIYFDTSEKSLLVAYGLPCSNPDIVEWRLN